MFWQKPPRFQILMGGPARVPCIFEKRGVFFETLRKFCEFTKKTYLTIIKFLSQENNTPRENIYRISTTKKHLTDHQGILLQQQKMTKKTWKMPPTSTMTFSGKKLCRNNKIKNTEEQTKKTLGASLHGQQQKKVFLPE